MVEHVPDAAEARLTGEPLIAHLATCHDECPHVAPVWFNYRDGVVEVTTTGRKLADIRANPRVALSLQADENGDALWGIAIRGTATVVEDEAEGQAVFRRVHSRYGADADDWSENTPVRIDVGWADYWEY